jgi:hypothetical protein
MNRKYESYEIQQNKKSDFFLKKITFLGGKIFWG